MAVRTESKEIGGKVYSVCQFPATEGLKLWTKLMNIASPAIAGIISSVDMSKGILDSDANIDSGSLGEAIKETLCELNESNVEFIKQLLSSTKVDGKEIVFDIDFSGDYGNLFKVVWFVIQTNYSSFFGESGLAILAEKIRTANQPLSETKS